MLLIDKMKSKMQFKRAENTRRNTKRKCSWRRNLGLNRKEKRI